MIKIINYHLKNSFKEPIIEWLEDLDIKTQSLIYTRLDRVSLGNFGDCKQLKDGNGVWELRIDYGPGYRIYFGKEGLKIVILLLGGNKSTQDRDITKAKQYWLDYKEGLMHDKKRT